MPTFKITAPDGTNYQVSNPDPGATEDQALQQVMAQHQSAPISPAQSTSSFPADAPNTTYGSILPIARDNTTGDLSLAAPEMIRSPARGLLSLAGRAGGATEAPTEANPNPSQALNQDELGALMTVSPTSAATSTPNAVRSLANGVGATGGFIKDAASDFVKPIASTPEAAAPTLAEQAAVDKAKASAGYSAQANVPFSDEQQQTLKGNLTALIPKSDAAQRVWNNSAASGHVNDLIDSMNTEPLTFDGALAQRSAINDSWSAAKRAGKPAEASQINGVKDALDQTMINPDTGQWQDANRQFGIAATKQDFSDMVDSALGKQQPANALSTSINNYLNSWRGKTLLPNEVDALKQVTSSSLSDELKRNVAGRLFSSVATGVGAGVGGVPGAVVGDLLGTYLSKVARNSAMADKIGGLQNFFDEIDKRPMPDAPKAGSAPLQLTDQTANTAFQRRQNVFERAGGTNTTGPNRVAFGPDASTTGIAGNEALTQPNKLYQGPMQPGVPFKTGAVGEPLGLPSPQSHSKTELATNPQGQNSFRTNAEQASVDASRANDVNTGMSQSVRQSIVKNAMSAKFGPEWDAIQSAEKSKILDQMDTMWDHKTPQSLQSMIDVAHQNMQDLNAAKGLTPGINNFGQSLRNALKVNFSSDKKGLNP